jgi:hypothetical protein
MPLAKNCEQLVQTYMAEFASTCCDTQRGGELRKHTVKTRTMLAKWVQALRVEHNATSWQR